MPLKNLLSRRSFRSLLRFLRSYGFGRRGQMRVPLLRLWYRMRLESATRAPESFTRLTRRREVLLWVDGGKAFPRILQLIDRARHTIVIHMFIWKDDRLGREIAAALLEAADRGVRVDITKDLTGDVFELGQDFLSTANSREPLWKRFWHHPQIHVTRADDRNHAKVYVFDGHVLVLGGMNISEEYLEWHDYMVELRGRSFVSQYLGGADPSEQESSDVRLFVNLPPRMQIRQCVRDLIASAKRSIVLEQSYVSDPEVIGLLAKKSREGIRITLITSEFADVHHHANMQWVRRLLAEVTPDKVEVFLYPGVIHGKLILVDRKRLFIGSTNLMRSSLDDMGEANVLIEGSAKRALRKIRMVIRKDILQSKPLLGPPKLRWASRFLAAIGL